MITVKIAAPGVDNQHIVPAATNIQLAMYVVDFVCLTYALVSIRKQVKIIDPSLIQNERIFLLHYIT